MHKPKKTGIGHNKQFGKLLSRGICLLVPKHEPVDILGDLEVSSRATLIYFV
jgi:hypothetical protein